MKWCIFPTAIFVMMPLSKPKLDILLAVALVIAVGVVFAPVRHFEFINFDDNVRVTDNVWVQQGLTAVSFVWAFQTFTDANWHPLTWLSHELDCQLFGLNPSGHHAMAVLLHAACTVLLYLFLRRSTNRPWPSAFVAALFAFHPQHVESVAWVSERKDVLSTLFFFATLLVYVGYTRKKSLGLYGVAIAFFALGLLSKPMLVTLPFVLLLLDYWPLKRWPGESSATRSMSAFGFLVREKLPFFVLSIASCVMTLYAQHRGGAMESTLVSPIPERLANAVVAYATYIGKMIVPRNLAIFYPRHHDALNATNVVLSILLLLVITIFVLWARRSSPFLLVGWLWFVGTLVPVIGIVQVGSQAYADRYTYVPFVGLFICVIWGFADLGKRRPGVKPLLVVAAMVVVLVFAALTREQLSYWRNSATVFGHALAVTRDNARAHDYFGQAMLDRGDTEEAIEHFQRSILLEPTAYQARYNLGVAHEKNQNPVAARRAYDDAIALRPDHFSSHYNLGVIVLGDGELGEARARFARAHQIEPDSLNAIVNLGIVLGMLGRTQEASRMFTKGLVQHPHAPDLHLNLAVLLFKENDYSAAQDHLLNAIAARPDDPVARRYLSRVQRALEHQTRVTTRRLKN